MDLDRIQKQPLFVENCLFFTALLLSFLMQFDLLVKCIHGRLSDRFSANLLINVTFWVLTCFAGLFNIGYVLVTVPAERNAYYSFWSGLIFGSLGLGRSFSITFMMLDRIFLLRQPFYYKRYRHSFVFWTIAMCSLACMFIFVSGIVSELPIEKFLACKVFTCILTRNGGLVGTVAKISVGFLNIFVSLTFYWTLINVVSQQTAQRHFKKVNLLVAISVLSEILYNFLPRTAIIACASVNGSICEPLGPYVGIMFGPNALTIAITYRWIIKPRIGCGNSIRITGLNTKQTSSRR